MYSPRLHLAAAFPQESSQARVSYLFLMLWPLLPSQHEQEGAAEGELQCWKNFWMLNNPLLTIAHQATYSPQFHKRQNNLPFR
jgi:hypothetical protein